MKLLGRYLEAVTAYLPDAQRDDIVTELSRAMDAHGGLKESRCPAVKRLSFW
jgi:hypothetical protein